MCYNYNMKKLLTLVLLLSLWQMAWANNLEPIGYPCPAPENAATFALSNTPLCPNHSIQFPMPAPEKNAFVFCQAFQVISAAKDYPISYKVRSGNHCCQSNLYFGTHKINLGIANTLIVPVAKSGLVTFSASKLPTLSIITVKCELKTVDQLPTGSMDCGICGQN